MAVKHGRKSADAAHNIGEALGVLLSSGDFSAAEFSLPSKSGAQLSMMGDVTAYGNVGGFDDSLVSTLVGYPSMEHATERELEKFTSRRSLTIMIKHYIASRWNLQVFCKANRIFANASAKYWQTHKNPPPGFLYSAYPQILRILS